METKEYTTLDKSGWGEGQWQAEPDKRQWRDESTGLPCLIVRSPGTGALCGYVGVSTDHPLHGKDYGAVDNVSVHGGLTFAHGCGHGDDESQGVCHVPGANEPDDVWWFGFDCAHASDETPAMQTHFMRGYVGTKYRNFSYVKEEVENLAQQIKALARTRPPASRRWFLRFDKNI